ncbi:hypothetical protein LXL04_019490 [Taraxacum kok-saghyz]
MEIEHEIVIELRIRTRNSIQTQKGWRWPEISQLEIEQEPGNRRVIGKGWVFAHGRCTSTGKKGKDERLVRVTDYSLRFRFLQYATRTRCGPDPTQICAPTQLLFPPTLFAVSDRFSIFLTASSSLPPFDCLRLPASNYLISHLEFSIGLHRTDAFTGINSSVYSKPFREGWKHKISKQAEVGGCMNALEGWKVFRDDLKPFREVSKEIGGEEERRRASISGPITGNDHCSLNRPQTLKNKPPTPPYAI